MLLLSFSIVGVEIDLVDIFGSQCFVHVYVLIDTLCCI